MTDAGDTGPTYPADTPVGRIDYATVSPGIRVTRTEVLDTPASDHRPVLAEPSIRR